MKNGSISDIPNRVLGIPNLGITNYPQLRGGVYMKYIPPNCWGSVRANLGRSRIGDMSRTRRMIGKAVLR